MRILKFEPQHYAANVALIININKEHNSRQMLLTPSGRIPAHTDQWQTYLSAVNFSKNDILESVVDKHYDMFTIDMLGYRELYMQILDADNNVVKTINVFEDWEELLSNILNLDMTMTSDETTNNISIHALSDGQVVTALLPRKSNARMYFANAHIASTRLLNIAIEPFSKTKYSLKFFAKLKRGDDVNVLVQPEMTYDTTDYNIITSPIGQRFVLGKNITSFELSCSMFGESMILCSDFNQLNKFAEFVDIFETSTSYILQFTYDINRTYQIVTNVPVVSDEAIPTNSLLVHSQDMLKHAGLIEGLLKRSKYIISLTKQLQYTLPIVYKTEVLHELPLYRWLKHTNNIAYERIIYYVDAEQTLSNTDYDRLTDFYFADVAIQSGLTTPSYIWSIYSQPDKKHGNTSLLFDMSADIEANYANFDLPIIVNHRVFYRNVEFVFKSDIYDGHAFAMQYKINTAQEDDVVFSAVTNQDVFIILCIVKGPNVVKTNADWLIGVMKLTMLQSYTIMPHNRYADFDIKLADS